MSRSFDAIVVGAGSGGLAFAKKAAKLGAKVALIEKDALGGTCVNRGCVPKKLLWEAAWHYELACAEANVWLRPAQPRPDFAALQRQIAGKISTINDSYAEACDLDGLTLIRGAAEVIGAQAVRVDAEDLRCQTLVLATGATPDRPDIPGGAATLTSDDVFTWTTLPDRLTLLGGGYIGCEFAAIFTAFGVKVALVDPGDRLLDGFDADLAALAQDTLQARGVDIHLGAAPTEIDCDGIVSLENGKTLSPATVVSAIGRTPRTHVPGGFTDTLELAETGAFAVDDGLATSAAGVYALGDCADRLPLTPVATRDAEALAARLFGDETPAPIDLSLVATAAFVMPPIAQIGETRGGACETGHGLQDQALTPHEHWSSQTAHKLAFAEGRLAGAALMGPAAAEAIGPLAAVLATSTGAPTAVHPSVSEEFIGRD